MSRSIVLIDLSSVARPIYEAASAKGMDAVAQCGTEIVGRIRALSSGQPHVAICCDAGRSFRKDISADYKAQRPETPEPYLFQLRSAIETLKSDGFPVWSVEGFEADDLIASCAEHAEAASDDYTVLIISADKDLLQLVSDRVTMFKQANGATPEKTYDIAAVTEKFGVAPNQMLDFLALVGDTSDNIKGAIKIGAVTAAKLLNTFGTLDDLYAALDKGEASLSPAVKASLIEFRPWMDTVRSLIRLRPDAPIPFEEVFRERVPADVAVFYDEEGLTDESGSVDGDTLGMTGPTSTVDSAHSGELPRPSDAAKSSDATTAAKAERNSPIAGAGSIPAHSHQQSLVVRESSTSAPAPAEWERQLEPRSIDQAKALADSMFLSRLFSAYGHPAGIMATVMAGRELGMPAMGSLRAFHIIDNKPTLSAGAIHALVLRSGLAEYFRCTERTSERCTFVTKRNGEPEMALTFTIEEAKQAWQKETAKFATSGWGRNPADMLVARASTKLARLVYPDVVHNLYASEEME